MQQDREEDEVRGVGEAHELDDHGVSYEHCDERLVRRGAQARRCGLQELVRGVPLRSVQEGAGGFDCGGVRLEQSVR